MSKINLGLLLSIVAGRGASRQAFPRGAWEREQILDSYCLSLQDAERPGRHSHAERGNENIVGFSFPRSAWECLHWTLRVRLKLFLVPTLRVGMPVLDAPRPAPQSGANRHSFAEQRNDE
jgi:hypothetical protein